MPQVDLGREMAMALRIEYCTAWNYKPRAAGLAAELKQALGIDSELVASHSGRFEISLDGRLVFSKKAEDRFPEPGEVVARLRAQGLPW